MSSGAGGVAAVKKLEAHRDKLERWAGAPPPSEPKLRPLGLASVGITRVEAAAADLKAALQDTDVIPLADAEWVWWSFVDDKDRRAHFSSALDQIHRVAAEQAAPQPGRPTNIDRDVFLDQLGLFWLRDLGLLWAHGPGAVMVQFIAAACGGVYDLGSKEKALSRISQALRAGDKQAGGPPKRRE